MESSNSNTTEIKEVMDTSASSWASLNSREEMLTKRRKEIFGDCALIEIIHLHDCLRGALKALHADVDALALVLATTAAAPSNNPANPAPSGGCQTTPAVVADLERRVAGRFKVIWSVFKSHSQAEDEFIWPALKVKTQGKISGSPKYAPGQNQEAEATKSDNNIYLKTGGGRDEGDHLTGKIVEQDDNVVEQEEYEEDHEQEEMMFQTMDALLGKLREVLVQDVAQPNRSPSGNGENDANQRQLVAVNDMGKALSDHTHHLSQHLMAHLEKEETQCMPLVIKHLSKSEIHDLVGNIMGKRSADTIAQIMTMAVQNLDEADRQEMVKYMKQSMAGTFFDRWLTMSGWNGSTTDGEPEETKKNSVCQKCVAKPVDEKGAQDDEQKRAAIPNADEDSQLNKRVRVEEEDGQDLISHVTEPSTVAAGAVGTAGTSAGAVAAAAQMLVEGSTTSQAELEQLIRAIAANAALTPEQKSTTIQGLRDSVWKSNRRQREINLNPPTVVNVSVSTGPNFPSQASASPAGPSSSSSSRTRRVTPPSMYFKKTREGKVELVWTSDSTSSVRDESVPLFSASELAPTYHDGAAGTVLGCPHYARACKLRHPTSGVLYTCRLCCQQQREMPMRDQDEPLDRYAVAEVYCMTCNTVQPAEDRCINADCESRGKPFAKYFCRICHLYDDGSRPIFHCPYCNTCRLGHGLGIDFRHCMRCNACVALSDTDHHCIPQKLQGSCPICHETLFQSTDPLRGLKCGHVMHLSCFTEYRRGHSYTCPLCMRSMEDMSDYFALLDNSIRMQPMPAAYLSTMSNIYCQDCGETGQTTYHFVGQKCPKCNSYNTREMGRVHNSPSSSPVP